MRSIPNKLLFHESAHRDSNSVSRHFVRLTFRKKPRHFEEYVVQQEFQRR
jgi:hypothetical protein